MNNQFGVIDPLVEMTTRIVSSHVANNEIDKHDLPDLIRRVFETLGDLASPDSSSGTAPILFVPVDQSVQPDYLVCLEDGKQLKMLKRYLKTHFDMTPEEYRLKWGLPADYPMVAPNYSKRRQELAREMGLGLENGKGDK